jgi:hypothetical protein
MIWSKAIRATVPTDATGREVWIGGVVSLRARAEKTLAE